MLKNRRGQNIVGIYTKPTKSVRGTCVIQHGWSGAKEQKHIITIQDAFLENGYQTFNFDTTNSFNESDGEYSNSRLGLHYEDFEDVVKWVQQQDWFVGPLALTGHSMGGYSAARYAEDYPEEVGLVAPIAPVISGKLTNEANERREPGMLLKWKELGYNEEKSTTRSGLIKRAPYEVHLEWQNHDLIPRAGNLVMPVFLLTGSEDTYCPPDHVQQLFEAVSHQNKVFEIVEGAPHDYKTEQDLATLKELLSRWLSSLESE